MELLYGMFVIVCLVGCNCTSQLINNYVEDPAFANMMCPTDQVEFQRVTRSAIDCAGTCDRTPGCTSLIYLHGSKTCYGIKSDNPFSTSIPLPGAVFYKPCGSSQVTTASPSVTTAMLTTESTSGSTGGGTTTSTTTGPTTTTTTTAATTTSGSTGGGTTTSTTTEPTTITTQTTTTAATTTGGSTGGGTTTRITTGPTTTTITAATTTVGSTGGGASTSTTTGPTSTTTTAATTRGGSTGGGTTTSITGPTIIIKTTTTTAATTSELTTTPNTGTPMVIGVADSQLTASSYWSGGPDYTPNNARLNNTLTSWAAETGYLNTEQYIQVDFLHQVQSTFVITKGNIEYAHWVKSYKVLTSTDCVSFVALKDGQGNDKIFTGNVDSDSEVWNAIVPPVICRCFRINPQTWNGWIVLRFEVHGHVV